jgi:hypothetical protein
MMNRIHGACPEYLVPLLPATGVVNQTLCAEDPRHIRTDWNPH